MKKTRSIIFVIGSFIQKEKEKEKKGKRKRRKGKGKGNQGKETSYQPLWIGILSRIFGCNSFHFFSKENEDENEDEDEEEDEDDDDKDDDELTSRARLSTH